jgi:hypothetical protein
MKLQHVIDGLKEGGITIMGSHYTNPLIDKLEREVGHLRDRIKEYTQKIKDNEPETRENQHQGMLNWYTSDLNDDLEFGDDLLRIDGYCFDCDENLRVVLIDEKTIAYSDYEHFYSIVSEKSGEGRKFLISDVKPCACGNLRERSKMVSRIEVPTGELVFSNLFRTKELYCDPNNEWGKPGINSILGRDALMQNLATRNVGFGQMGNMSADICSNGKDEIYVCNTYPAARDNAKYYEDHPERFDEMTEKEKKMFYKDLEDSENLEKKFVSDGFILNGNVSMSVWRWQCADKFVLDSYGEDLEALKNDYIDVVTLKVEPGTWEIEHYYDFPCNGNVIYSKLIKVK